MCRVVLFSARGRDVENCVVSIKHQIACFISDKKITVTKMIPTLSSVVTPDGTRTVVKHSLVVAVTFGGQEK